MLGQNHHFTRYAPEKIPYAIERYVRETGRLYGVLNTRLAEREFLAGAYSIADMACWGWVVGASRMHDLEKEFPHVKAWRDKIGARPAVDRGFKLARELREQAANDPKAEEERRRILFGQRARP
jgi:glutathione S-transferase